MKTILSLIILLAIVAGVYYWFKNSNGDGEDSGAVGGGDISDGDGKPEKPEVPFEESKK